MRPDFDSAVSSFGASAKRKLTNPGARGEPEDQLRAPFEQLIADLVPLIGFKADAVAMVGESAVRDLKTRPDYAVTVAKTLIGFIELKSPGKGADPRKFKDPHDKEQWEKLRTLPNLLYSDGTSFSLWQDGEQAATLIELAGDLASSGDHLAAPPELLHLLEKFLRWDPIPPRSAKELAQVTARLCRLLRDEVTEQLAAGSKALTALATDWRKLLFPDATDERFADGYAQAVTFGLLMARAKGIRLADGLPRVGEELGKTSSLIGAALRLLTDNAESQATLKTSLGTLTRVLDAVQWATISKGDPEAWLYFYEEFLEVYDNKLRKQTGSYYTPPEVVGAMVRLVDEALKSPRFGLSEGMASPIVTLADPATGTGTFMLGVLRKIAETVRVDQGAGAVRGAINAAVQRLIAFEMQLGPFAVAQLRILAEIVELTGAPPKTAPRMFVTNTLGNPDDDESWIPGILAPIARSRREANKIKRDEPITVVIGNPPYKEKAKGLGGWIEGDKAPTVRPPLLDWIPPPSWGIGAHARHLRNLYVYFWRWATWKVFDQNPSKGAGIVCFITAAGFLGGSGFQRMRDYLRRTCEDVWVIDCSPEGHRPDVNTRIFQGVQQPICIVLASRSVASIAAVPARVLFRSLPAAHRDEKLASLGALELTESSWIECPSGWRAPFLPASTGVWATFPPLEDLFTYDGTGVMVGRTWVISPDAESLHLRWQALVGAPPEKKELLFHPHMLSGALGDRHSERVVKDGLPGLAHSAKSVASERGTCPDLVRYGMRSFDRQWIIADNRLINRPNPELWSSRSEHQIYLTAPGDRSPTAGPALTVTAAVPDAHHYNGRGGRVMPLWRDRQARVPNVRPKVIDYLSRRLGESISAEDLAAYIVATLAQPGFTSRFQPDLSTPGLRVPLTAQPEVFRRAAEIGRRVIWLHTFGERMADPTKARPGGPPRLPVEKRPGIPADGAISEDPDVMPDTIRYDIEHRRLLIGQGFIDNVDRAVWEYEVSGKQVLLQWFSYRKANRDRPMIGDRRPPSPLGEVQPDHWIAEYTTELINVVNVLGCLVALEPEQARLLQDICDGPQVSYEELREADALTSSREQYSEDRATKPPSLFD
jgi:hypothetical protein